MKRTVLLGLGLLLCACKSSDRIPAAPGTGNNVDAGDEPYDGPKDAGRDSGKDSGADSGTDLLAPVVTFTSPVRARDPNGDDVLTETMVKVRCKVEPSSATGAALVDKSAVKLQLQSPNKEAFVDSTVSAISATEFEAMFDLSGHANGEVTFKCSGKDLSGTHMASATLSTLLDLGPEITLTKPIDKHTYALKTPMAIEFQVSGAPLNDDDKEATVKTVVLTIGGVETPVEESKTTPGLYQTSIDFSDKNKFPVQPTSAQLQVLATNSRSPKAPTRVARADVLIDGSGPEIVVKGPPYGTIQHGNVLLEIVVNDPSGITADSLIATINTKPYTSWKGTAPNFAQTFDTRDIDKKNELTQLTINITAIDSVGNKTDPPVSHLIRLDNLPPVISLDPPPIRESRLSGSDVYCSQAFDAVGSLAASDLQSVMQAQVFRALVEDRTNRANGALFSYLSGTDPASVAMYTQALDKPLLVDTNNDGKCDAINKSDDFSIPPDIRVNADQDPVKIKLEAVNPDGNSWFAKPGAIGAVDDPACPGDPGGTDAPPANPCTTYTDIWRVVPGRIQGDPPAVYGFAPSNNTTTGACHGSDWEISGNTRGREGWICVAARAEDNIKNVGISAPLRLCFDDGDSGNGVPSCNTGEAPSCTDGCTISAAQKFTSDTWPL